MGVAQLQGLKNVPGTLSRIVICLGGDPKHHQVALGRCEGWVTKLLEASVLPTGAVDVVQIYFGYSLGRDPTCY